MRAFFVRQLVIFGAKILYKKRARKTLMKLTTGGLFNERAQAKELSTNGSRYWHSCCLWLFRPKVKITRDNYISSLI